MPSLDVPVPQMVDQLPDIEYFFAALSPDPEQVIEVPKILPLDVPMRAALRVAQLVEQLVEVPTTVFHSSLQRTVEQHVDIPVPGGGGPSSGLHVSPQDSVQHRRLPENAFLSRLWSRSLTLCLVEVFLVHIPLTLQLVMKNVQMNLTKGFFALFPKLKKVRRSLRTRGRNCLRTPAHPRRRLSWRTPLSGCGSRMTILASRTTGTDAFSVLSGSHHLAARWCGMPQGMRRGLFTSGTRKRVSPRLLSLLFRLGEELHRQPKAVYEYWVGRLPSCDQQRQVFPFFELHGRCGPEGLLQLYVQGGCC